MHKKKSKQENRIHTKNHTYKNGLDVELGTKKRKSNMRAIYKNLKSFSSDRLEIIVQWIGSQFIRNVFQFLKTNAQQIIRKNSIDEAQI